MDTDETVVVLGSVAGLNQINGIGLALAPNVCRDDGGNLLRPALEGVRLGDTQVITQTQIGVESKAQADEQ